MSVVLIGFMCSGKSTVGKCLAQRLQLEFVDTDTLVENLTNLSVAEIFARHGEPYFRMLERQAVTEIYTSAANLVIATGGGIVENPLNMILLRQLGMVVWLQTGLQTVLERAVVHQSQRPLLGRGEKFLRELFKTRDKLYARYADFAISGESSVSCVVEEVAARVSHYR